MPLQVHCPNGCVLKMPANRAGKIVRCPQCKSTIEIGKISDAEKGSAQPDSVHAKLVANKPLDLPENDGSSAEKTPDIPDTASTRPRLEIPPELSPLSIKKNKESEKSNLNKILSTPKPVVEFKHIAVTPRRKKKRRQKKSKTIAVNDTERKSESFELAAEKTPWEDRVRKSNAERVLLARFFALSLCAVAVINLFPAFYFWIDWSRSLDARPLPRWIYLQVFMAAIHLVYAIFLFQVPDWASM